MPDYAYVVTATKYNADKSHIVSLRVHPVDGKGNWNSQKYEQMSRADVVELIKKNKAFATAYKKNGEWTLGADLEQYEVKRHFLKTKQDDSLRDNLENLPEFE